MSAAGSGSNHGKRRSLGSRIQRSRAKAQRWAVKCRTDVSRKLNLEPPRMEQEVMGLIDNLEVSHAEVKSMYRVFRKYKRWEYCNPDNWLAGAGPNEISTNTCLKLVSSQKHWIWKILKHLLELGGCRRLVNWNSFLYIFLRFCSLTKIELCQAMFFIILSSTRNWSVWSLSPAQLEDFYDDYTECPIHAFNTGNIDWDDLPIEKYRVSDFVELMYSNPPLLNPCLHLQNELRKSIPSLAFWTDVDKMHMHMWKIGFDFFRCNKVLSILDALQVVKGQAQKRQEEIDASSPLVKDIASPATRESNEVLRPGLIPLPLGPTKPVEKRDRPEPARPDWMETHMGDNYDPIHGTALGTNAEVLRAPDVLPALPKHWKAVPDPDRPKRLYYWNTLTDEVTWTPPPVLETVSETKERVKSTMGPRLSRVKPGSLSEGLITRPGVMNSQEKMNAQARTMELDFVRDYRLGDSKGPSGIVGKASVVLKRAAKVVNGYVN